MARGSRGVVIDGRSYLLGSTESRRHRGLGSALPVAAEHGEESGIGALGEVGEEAVIGDHARLGGEAGGVAQLGLARVLARRAPDLDPCASGSLDSRKPLSIM